MLKSDVKNILRKLVYSFPSSYVFMFHHVTDNPEIKKSGCLLETIQFQEIVNLHEHYVTLDAVVEKPSCKGISITFDDGLLDLYTVAYPFLKKKGIPFTAFIVTEYLDKQGYITKEQLKEMSKDPLVTIGSHGVTHKVLPQLTAEDKKNELINSKRIIEDIIGKEVSYYAYSHGQYDQDTLKHARVYKAAFSTTERPLNIITGRNKYTIPRYNIDTNTYRKQIDFFSHVKLKEI